MNIDNSQKIVDNWIKEHIQFKKFFEFMIEKETEKIVLKKG